MAGLFIGGAVHGIPVVVDGAVSAMAAYCAFKLAPSCRGAMLASHLSSEPAAALVMDTLELNPVIDAGMHLGEGAGGVCLLPLLDAALALYSGATFDDIGIKAYEENPQ
jgi:NaMN:DMB phosphoribosyltransferase